MRKLPTVTSLRDAALTVIKSNKADGYHPNYFSQVITNSDNPQQLLDACTNLIKSNSAYSTLFDAFQKRPNLLTLEDFVAREGIQWGFSKEIVDQAKQRVQNFDLLANRKRYEE